MLAHYDVYAIEGIDSVFVGISKKGCANTLLSIATALGWNCGVVRELPEGTTRAAARRAGYAVAKAFMARGFRVVGHCNPVEAVAKIKQWRMQHLQQCREQDRKARKLRRLQAKGVFLRRAAN